MIQQRSHQIVQMGLGEVLELDVTETGRHQFEAVGIVPLSARPEIPPAVKPRRDRPQPR